MKPTGLAHPAPPPARPRAGRPSRAAATAALLLAAALPGAAQQAQPPAAAPVEPELRQDPGNDYFQRGRNIYDAARRAKDHALRTAEYERAIPIFTDYLTRFGNHQNAPAAWYYLGQCYYQTARLDEASRCFHTVLQRFGKGPYAAAAASALAVDHYSRKEYAIAATLFERSAANAPRAQDQQRAHYYRAMCLHQLGRANEAIAAYRKVVELEPHGTQAFSHRAKVSIAHLLERAGRDKEAFAAFEDLVTNAAEQEIRGEAALFAGVIAGKLGQAATSERYLQMVLTTPGMEPWRPRAQVALMSNRYNEKNYAAVIEIFNRSAAPAEGIDEGRRQMFAALAHMQLGAHAKALELFRGVERAVPPDSDLAFDAAYNRLLCFYKVDGEHVDEQADAFLQIYHKGRPKDPRVHTAMLMKAETLFARHKLREAAETYNAIDAALVSEANRPGLLFQRGWCLAGAGDYQGAIRSLTKFLADYPEDPRVPEALAKRADAAIRNDDRSAALRDLDQLIGLNPPPKLAAFAWQKSARICKDEGNLDEMIRRYQTLCEKIPSLEPEVLANANYWIGWGHFKSERLKECLPWLRKAREADAKTYGNQAGLVLILALFSLQDIDSLAAEIQLAIDGGYVDQVPGQALRWIGTQVYNAGDYRAAARFLALVATPDDPRQTPKVVWRYLGKARLEINQPTEALVAIEHVLEVEDQDVWKADALLDKCRALLALKRPQDALDAGNQALALRPQGRIGSGLRLGVGDAESALRNLDEAVKHYAYVVEFVDDRELRPQALRKLIHALETKGDKVDADRYRKILADEYPERPATPAPQPDAAPAAPAAPDAAPQPDAAPAAPAAAAPAGAPATAPR